MAKVKIISLMIKYLTFPVQLLYNPRTHSLGLLIRIFLVKSII